MEICTTRSISYDPQGIYTLRARRNVRQDDLVQKDSKQKIDLQVHFTVCKLVFCVEIFMVNL